MSHQSSSSRSQKEKVKARTPAAAIPPCPLIERPSEQQPGPDNLRYFATFAKASTPYISPYADTTETNTQLPTAPTLSSKIPSSSRSSTLLNPALREISSFDNIIPSSRSTYSSLSADSSIYSSPSSQQYMVDTPVIMSNPKQMSSNEKQQLIRSLQTHRVNTLIELRRIEKVFASLNSAEVTEPMTTAWAYYVNSNNLLSELRGLTKNYPFSSECLDDSKWQVIGDPASTRSWNYCWLVLSKIQSEGLIQRHARLQAIKPTMWGGRIPTAAGVEKLATACVAEWTRALHQMLRHWDSPPSTTGR